jgi:putative membrane protein
LDFIAVASTVTGVLGAILAPLRVLLADWGFTLSCTPDGLRIRRGLAETRSQTVPVGRVQAVAVEWPLLWRLAGTHGWVRASMHVAGVRTAGRGEAQASLLPVGTVEHARDVVRQAIPGFVLTDVVVRPTPRRAMLLAPLRRLVLGYQQDPAAFVSQEGLITQRQVIVPYGRIQSVRIRQGPAQRLLRLASVYVDVAGADTQAVAQHRDVREARALAIDLADRSRAARIALA